MVFFFIEFRSGSIISNNNNIMFGIWSWLCVILVFKIYKYDIWKHDIMYEYYEMYIYVQ